MSRTRKKEADKAVSVAAAATPTEAAAQPTTAFLPERQTDLHLLEAAPSTSFVVRGPRFEAGNKYFDEVDLLRLENLQERLQNRIKDVGLLQARISRLRAEHERTMALCVQEHALLQREVERAERSLQDFHRVVEASYGIDMRRIVYDDVTGRITDSAGFIASEPGKPPVGLAVLW